jgi:hypothetical protein
MEVIIEIFIASFKRVESNSSNSIIGNVILKDSKGLPKINCNLIQFIQLFFLFHLEREVELIKLPLDGCRLSAAARPTPEVLSMTLPTLCVQYHRQNR